MNPQTALRITAVIGFLAVALGAFGAHGLHDLLEKNGRLATWETAAHYHLTHAVVMLVISTMRPVRGVHFGPCSRESRSSAAHSTRSR